MNPLLFYLVKMLFNVGTKGTSSLTAFRMMYNCIHFCVTTFKLSYLGISTSFLVVVLLQKNEPIRY